MATLIVGNVDRSAAANGFMLPFASDTSCARSDPWGTETTGVIVRERKLCSVFVFWQKWK
ncbi:hypothetical protein HK11_03560 [Acetobacter sp. DmW_043]|nr:hypothetical protein HK11_03560 [Acetobacter sp. DmW_043]